MTTLTDPTWPVPRRTEPRAEEPPPHNGTARPVLPLAVAARMARDRLESWRRDHGHLV
jgi:hypothetical protein